MQTAGFRNVLDCLRTTISLPEALNLSDGQLLERFVTARDEVAFEALLRRHGPMVLGVCRRLLSNPCDAEDAFQATFLVLARKAASILPREKVGNFLYGVAFRAAQKLRAASARRRERERQVRTLPEPATLADGLWHDLVPLLDQELSRLPEKYRLPLVLCDLEGRTRTEAAQQLRWPEGTVAGRLARARALLASRLARHGLPVSAGVLTALLAENTASACVPVALVAATGKAALAFVSSSVFATCVSAKVAILTTEILQIMLRSKLKVVMAGVLLAAVTMGFAGVTLHRAWAVRPAEPGEVTTADDLPMYEKEKPGWKPGPKADNTVKLDPATKDKIHSLQLERRDALKKAVECRLNEYEAGRGTLESLLNGSKLLLKAELDLANTKEQRIAAHAALLELATKVLKISKERYEAGRVTEADHQQVRAARLEAEIGWLKAGGGKEKKEK